MAPVGRALRLGLALALLLGPGTSAKGLRAEAGPTPRAERGARTDRQGDPLPPGAVGRLGTVRLRHGATVRALDFSPDGKTLAARSPDARTVASASQDDSVRPWDLATGKARRQITGPAKGVPDAPDGNSITYCSNITFSPDGKTLAYKDHRHGVRLWEVATGRERSWLRGPHRDVVVLAFSPVATWLGAAWLGLAPNPPLVAQRARLGATLHDNRTVFSVAFSPDGKTLASGGGDKAIKLWDVAGGKEKAALKGHTAAVFSVAFSPDGRTLASGGGDKTIKLWEVAAGREMATLKGHAAAVLSVAFSPDGKTLASGGRDKTIKLWDVAGGKERSTLEGHTHWVTAVRFSPDGKALASGSHDRTIKLWDVANGKEEAILEGHTKGVVSVAYCPDGKALASASLDATVRLWEVATGRTTATLEQGSGMVLQVAFSPDGKVLASGGQNDRVRLWEVATGKNTATFSTWRYTWPGGTEGPLVFALAFSPDGKALASGGERKSIQVLSIDSTAREKNGNGCPTRRRHP
jgi:WD40 repeat protein